MASHVAIAVKNPPASAGDIRDTGLVPGLGRSSGRGHGNPLQYSCLEKLMNRGAWHVRINKFSKTIIQHILATCSNSHPKESYPSCYPIERELKTIRPPLLLFLKEMITNRNK